MVEVAPVTKLATPLMPKMLPGVVEPMAAKPAWLMTKSFRVDEPTANSGCPAVRLVVSTERRAHGVVVPMPTLPAPLIRKRTLVPSEVEDAISKLLPLLVSMPSVHWLPVPAPSENSRDGLVVE